MPGKRGSLAPSHDDALRGTCGVTRVRRPGWFDEEQLGFFLSERLMFDPHWHDEHLARTEGDVASLMRIVTLPFNTRKKSSVSSW